MKKILTIIIGLLASGIALPASAQAGSLRIGYSSIYTSGHHSCGCAIRKKRVVIGYDCYHRPIFRYYPVATRHSCRGHGRAHSSYNNHRSHYRSGYRGREYRNHYERRRSQLREQRRIRDRGHYRRSRSRTSR